MRYNDPLDPYFGIFIACAGLAILCLIGWVIYCSITSDCSCFEDTITITIGGNCTDGV